MTYSNACNTCMFYLLFYLSLAPLAQAQFMEEDDEDALAEIYGGEDMVSIATGFEQSLAKAPAVASVITAQSIRKMGATDLDEILETIPGLHVSRNATRYSPIYTFRGIRSLRNPQVLTLINGIPITNLQFGNRGQLWGGMPVAAIERIEVIRGPGSALYGADAFAGVINIKTKAGSDIAENSATVRGGSFATRDLALLLGGEFFGAEIGFAAEYHQTDGHREIIDSDRQSFNDARDGTDASLAPGPLSLSRDNLDLRLDILKGPWRFRGGLQRRTDAGIGAGIAEALDPVNRYRSDRFSVDVTWNDPLVGDHWDLSAQLSYLDTTLEVEENLVIFPPGFAGVYPQGLIGNPEVFERHGRVNASAFYSGLKRHQIRAGVGYYLGDLYKVKEEKNFGPDPATGTPLPPTSPLVDVSDTPFVFLPEDDRENYFLYLQDVWNLANDWELTAGIRYDDYSDFGSTTNPRLALVWSLLHNLTTKLLYGEAFRAPSFAETRATNNPVALGNPDLAPETLESIELAFDYHPNQAMTILLNLYHYSWKDIITFVPDAGSTTNTAQNAAEQEGKGWELEINWRPARTLKLAANFSFTMAEDRDTDSDAASSPQKQLFIKTTWDISEQLYLYAQANSIMDRAREPGDTRANIEDYTRVDATIGYQSATGAWSVRTSVNNIFDEDVREPSEWSNPAYIPNDLPQEGRNYRADLTLRF